MTPAEKEVEALRMELVRLATESTGIVVPIGVVMALVVSTIDVLCEVAGGKHLASFYKAKIFRDAIASLRRMGIQ